MSDKWYDRLQPEPGADFPGFAWPGGYAIAYNCLDGGLLCAKCVNDESNPVLFVTERELSLRKALRQHDPSDDQWTVIGFQTADWHDTGEPDWICDHCNAVIDAAVEE